MMNRRTSVFSSAFLWSLLGMAALTALLVVSPTAREVALEAGTTLLGIVTTPFILESTIAIIFFCALMLINQWRLKKEGDGWVYLVSQEQDPGAKLPASITQRLQGIVMDEKPGLPDEAQTECSRIEGYLELGMPAQAREELDAQTDLPDDARTALLRMRVLAANLDTEPARTLLRETLGRFPEARMAIIQAVAETCTWFTQHLPTHTAENALWREEARQLGLLHL
jgi:hypothetical protein